MACLLNMVEGGAVPNAALTGTGLYVPPQRVTNHDLVTRYGVQTTDEWIVQRTGIVERRFAEPGVTGSDLALEASKRALANAGLPAAELDLILYCTLSPDMTFPGGGVFLQRKLGVLDGDAPTFVPAMDIRNQCSGFIYGLATAKAYVQANMARHVLLVGAEVQSAALDLSTQGRDVSSLFGDGAGAVIVSATSEDRGVRGCILGADGRQAESLCIRVWDMHKRPYIDVDERGRGIIPSEYLWPQMDGKKVFKQAVERLTEVVLAIIKEHECSLDEIDRFYFHQANLRINQLVGRRLGLPEEKMAHNIERYGNTTAATLPTMLAEDVESGQLGSGMRILLAAFGSGFTWGAAIVDW